MYALSFEKGLCERAAATCQAAVSGSYKNEAPDD